MTFKNLFTKIGFETTVNADFCIVVSNGEAQYALFFDVGIKCLSLIDFQEVDINILSYLFDLSLIGEVDEKDEFQFGQNVSKEQIIIFLFGLVALDDRTVKDKPKLVSCFGEDIFMKSGSDQLALLLLDKDGKAKNVLLFDEDSCNRQFLNSDCCWVKGKEEENVIIAYNPYILYRYYIEDYRPGYAIFIMPLNSSMYYLEYPFEYNFTNYILLCNTRDEKLEALKLIVVFMNKSGRENVQFTSYLNKGELEFILDADAEVLHYVQFVADLLRNLKDVYLGESQQGFNTFKMRRRIILGKKIIYIAFNLNVPELDVLTYKFIKKYQLPFNIVE